MSAFVVGKPHIDALVSVALWGPYDAEGSWQNFGPIKWFESPVDLMTPRTRADLRKATKETADAVGQMLVTENVRSVTYLYRWHNPDSMVPNYTRIPYTYQVSYISGVVPRLTTAEALKAIDCYEYQACEHPEWEQSEAKQFCEALRKHIINHLTGYDAAPWERTS